MHHLSVIRSLDSKEGNHDRGTYLMHTGYVPNPTVVHPGWGSVVRMSWASSSRTWTCPTASRSTSRAWARVPGHVVLSVHDPEPHRADRQLEAPWRVLISAVPAAARHAGGVENDFIAQRKSQMAVDHKAVYTRPSG